MLLFSLALNLHFLFSIIFASLEPKLFFTFFILVHVVVYFLCCLCLLVGFSIGEVAILEQEREETGMGPASFGYHKLNSDECYMLLQAFGQQPIHGMKKEVYVQQLQTVMKNKMAASKASGSSGSSGDSHHEVMSTLFTMKAELLQAIGDIKKTTVIKHFHIASNGNDSNGDDSDDDDNDDDQKEGTNDNDHNDDDQNEGTNDNDQSDDDQNEGTNDDDKNEQSVKVVYRNSDNEPDTFMWTETTTIEDLINMVGKSHPSLIGDFRLVHNGKRVDSFRRIREYLGDSSNGEFVAMLKLHGGMGKRARTVAIGAQDMSSKVGDSEALTACFAFTMPDIKKFAMDMDLNTLNKFRDMVAQSKANPDRISTNALPFIPEAVTLEAIFSQKEGFTVNCEV